MKMMDTIGIGIDDLEIDKEWMKIEMTFLYEVM